MLDGSTEYTKMLENYHNIIIELHNSMVGQLSKNLENEDEVNKFLAKAREQALAMQDELDFLMEKAVARENVLTQQTDDTVNMLMVVTTIIGVVIGAIVLLLAVIIAKSITKPLKTITEHAISMSKGNMTDITASIDGKNEIVELDHSILQLNASYQELISGINSTFTAIGQGNFSTNIDTDKLEGEFCIIGKQTNDSIKRIKDDYKVISDYLNKYAQGDLSSNCPRMEGDKSIIHESFDTLKVRLGDIVNVIDDITNSIDQGDLTWKIDTSNMTGEWQVIGDSLNKLVKHTADPIEETIRNLDELSNGNLNISIEERKYKGDFRRIAVSLNKTAKTMNEYVNEIAEILRNIADRNLAVTLSKTYIGDFQPIKTSLELILSTLNRIMKNINDSASQLSHGADCISSSSQQLAAASTEQDSVTRNVNDSIKDLMHENDETTESIKLAGQQLASAQKDAVVVREEMSNLLTAMNDISKASHDVGSILKAINEVASSTNLLSLNASVEAARAGEAGKGFAVVANEVGNLAKRSQANTKESTELISVQLDKANLGLNISNEANKSVIEIINLIEGLSGKFANIVDEFEKQTKVLLSVSKGIEDITSATASNLESAETLAATAQQLSSQATTFKEMVKGFKLK